jgi:long-chain acyl-CoA synthetase
MYIDFLLDRFNNSLNAEFMIWKENSYDYKWLINDIEECNTLLESYDIENGEVVALEGDFTPRSISLLLALIQKSCLVIPLVYSNAIKQNQLLEISNAESIIRVDKYDNVTFEKISTKKENEYYSILRAREHPGLILFTSGTSGEPKAAVHDFVYLLEKFKRKRHALRTLNFLMFDHWGGLNTMFYIISNNGVVIASKERSPDIISALIEKFRIQLLPASPTFFNLLILSECYKNYNMESLEIISYGTEPMPEITLNKLNEIFPDVKITQTYGLIELGVMNSKSEKNNSLWVKVGGDGYKTRVVDGILQIKSTSAMLGYLNAPSPFTEDGWFITGDKVLQKNGYIKILGRESEIINVGGEKVYPQEVENVILKLDNILDVVVFSEKNPLIGNIVCANVTINTFEEINALRSRIKLHCRKNLKKFMVPVKIQVSDSKLHGNRFKKIRKIGNIVD